MAVKHTIEIDEKEIRDIVAEWLDDLLESSIDEGPKIVWVKDKQKIRITFEEEI